MGRLNKIVESKIITKAFVRLIRRPALIVPYFFDVAALLHVERPLAAVTLA